MPRRVGLAQRPQLGGDGSADQVVQCHQKGEEMIVVYLRKKTLNKKIEVRCVRDKCLLLTRDGKKNETTEKEKT